MAKYESLYRDTTGNLAVELVDNMEQPTINPPKSQQFPEFRLSKEELLPDVGLVAK